MNDSRRKKNQKTRNQLKARKRNAYRRKAGLDFDQEEARLASHLRRFVAFAIDSILGLFFYLAYLFFVNIIFKTPPPFLSGAIIPSSIFGLAYLSYKIGKNGATYGCKRAGIVVIDKSGTGFIGYQRALIRWFVLSGIINVLAVFLPPSLDEAIKVFITVVISTISFFVYLPAFFTPLRQGFHDQISNSVVLNNKDLPFIIK